MTVMICSAGYPDGTTNVIDPVTLSPRGEPFDVVTNCAAPIGDGSTAMVHEWSGDAASAHWRVIDVNAGAVRSEGDVDLLCLRLGRLSRRIDGRGWRGTPARSSPSTSRPENSADPPASVPRCPGSTTPTTDSGWSPAPSTAASACGTPPTLDLLGTVYPPRVGEAVTGRPRSSSATAHDVRDRRRTTARVYRWETDLDADPLAMSLGAGSSRRRTACRCRCSVCCRTARSR